MTLIPPNGPCPARTTFLEISSRFNRRCTPRPFCYGASRAIQPGSGPSRRTRLPACSSGAWASPPGCCPAPAAHAGVGFVCSPGRAPWVYAALERPVNGKQQLYRAPAFNVFRDGRVCPGSHRFPEDAGPIPESFFQSFLSLTGDTRERSKQHPDDLKALWEELDGKAEYPVEDLVPQCTVGHVMAVSEGRRGYYP